MEYVSLFAKSFQYYGHIISFRRTLKHNILRKEQMKSSEKKKYRKYANNALLKQ